MRGRRVSLASAHSQDRRRADKFPPPFEPTVWPRRRAQSALARAPSRRGSAPGSSRRPSAALVPSRLRQHPSGAYFNEAAPAAQNPDICRPAGRSAWPVVRKSTLFMVERTALASASGAARPIRRLGFRGALRRMLARPTGQLVRHSRPKDRPAAERSGGSSVTGNSGRVPALRWSRLSLRQRFRTCRAL